jgi:hypothetical protein
MIPGIVAQSIGVASAPPVDDVDEIMSADFVTGAYRLDGASVAIADLFDDANADRVDAGVGYSISGTISGTYPVATTALRSLILAALPTGISVEIEWFGTGRTSYAPALVISETGDDWDDDLNLRLTLRDDGNARVSSYSASSATVTLAGGSNQIHKAAATINLPIGGGLFQNAASSGGATAATISTGTDGSFAAAVIRFFHSVDFGSVESVFGVTIRSVRITSPRAAADLPGASIPATLSTFAQGAVDFADVALLVDFDGAQDATTATDASSAGRTLTFAGSPTGIIDQAQKVFGTASYRQNANGQYISVPSASVFSFGTGAFSVDMWVRIESGITDTRSLVGVFEGTGTRSWRIQAKQDQVLFASSPDGTNISTGVTVPASLAEGSFHHVAVSRSAAGRLRIHLDGQLIAARYYPLAIHASSAALLLGNVSTSLTTSNFRGWLDELRIVSGANPFDVEGNITLKSAAY